MLKKQSIPGLSQRMKEARKDRKLSVRTASEMAVVDVRTILAIEEEQCPTVPTLLRLAVVYGVSVDWLLKGSWAKGEEREQPAAQEPEEEDMAPAEDAGENPSTAFGGPPPLSGEVMGKWRYLSCFGIDGLRQRAACPFCNRQVIMLGAEYRYCPRCGGRVEP